MEMDSGLSLEDPHVDIPWGISETELAALIGVRLRKITTGYFTLTCTSLPGLTHELGFHLGTLRDLIRKLRAPLVVVASENPGDAYVASTKNRSHGRANLVMTL
jgi:hypothetical protein